MNHLIFFHKYFIQNKGDAPTMLQNCGFNFFEANSKRLTPPKLSVNDFYLIL